jgi:hypothetical protein
VEGTDRGHFHHRLVVAGRRWRNLVVQCADLTTAVPASKSVGVHLARLRVDDLRSDWQMIAPANPKKAIGCSSSQCLEPDQSGISRPLGQEQT